MSFPDMKKIKAIANPLRARILEVLGKEKKGLTIKRTAELIDEKPTNLHYHFKLLEAAGFIEVAATREVNGITERFYRMAGGYPDIMLSFKDDTEAVKEIVPLMGHKTLAIINRISKIDSDEERALIGMIKEYHFTPAQATQAKQALQNLLANKSARLPEETDKKSGDHYDLILFFVPNIND